MGKILAKQLRKRAGSTYQKEDGKMSTRTEHKCVDSSWCSTEFRANDSKRGVRCHVLLFSCMWEKGLLCRNGWGRHTAYLSQRAPKGPKNDRGRIYITQPGDEGEQGRCFMKLQQAASTSHRWFPGAVWRTACPGVHAFLKELCDLISGLFRRKSVSIFHLLLMILWQPTNCDRRRSNKHTF